MVWPRLPFKASYRPRHQSEVNGDDPTNHDSVMTDFDRTSNSETANILSTSCDKLLVTVPTHSCENLKPRTGLMTHEEFTLAAIEDTPDLALRMAASYSSGEVRRRPPCLLFLIGEEYDLMDVLKVVFFTDAG